MTSVKQPKGEFQLIEKIRRLLIEEGVKSDLVVVGIGDDGACFRPQPGFDVVVSCDSMVEGQHFLRGLLSSFELGRRAMMVNISDIGAMGARPLYALVSLGLKGGADDSDIEALYRGFLAELNPLGASIIGGNITRVGESVFIDVTLIGEVEKGQAIQRSGAQPGDVLLVTGYPGQSAAGLELLHKYGLDAKGEFSQLVSAYVAPGHRALEARAIAKLRCISAMIDTSDGLSADLGHICEQSGVGATVILDQLPVSDSLRRGARLLEKEPHEFVLGASDDYELIVTCPPGEVDRLRACVASVSEVPLHEIGRITQSEEGLTLDTGAGGRCTLNTKGWNHLIDKPVD